MRCLSVLVLTLALTLSARAADPVVVKLWPGKAPGETKDIGPEKEEPSKPGQLQIKRLGNVSDPTISVYPAPKDKATGAAVLGSELVGVVGGGTGTLAA